MNALNPSYWVGQADKTIEIIENLNFSWNYAFIIKQLSRNVHNFVQSQIFYHYKPISPYSIDFKEAIINEKHTLNHINNINNVN